MPRKDWSQEWAGGSLPVDLTVNPYVDGDSQVPAQWVELPGGGTLTYFDGSGRSQTITSEKPGYMTRITVRKLVSLSGASPNRVRAGTGDGPQEVDPDTSAATSATNAATSATAAATSATAAATSATNAATSATAAASSATAAASSATAAAASAALCGKPSTANKHMACADVTAASGENICATGLAATPKGYVRVFIQGSPIWTSDGDKTGQAYWSGDSGTTARALSAVVSGDKLYFGAAFATIGDLTSSNFADFDYNS